MHALKRPGVSSSLRFWGRRGAEECRVAAAETEQLVSSWSLPVQTEIKIGSLSPTDHTPAGGISSASPAEWSAPGCAAGRISASHRLPPESSSVTVSRNKTGNKQTIFIKICIRGLFYLSYFLSLEVNNSRCKGKCWSLHHNTAKLCQRQKGVEQPIIG